MYYPQFKPPFLDIKNYDFDVEVVRIIPEEISNEHKVIAIDKMEHILTVGMVHPEDKNLVAFLEQELKYKIIPFQISLSDWQETIQSAYIEKEVKPNYIG